MGRRSTLQGLTKRGNCIAIGLWISKAHPKYGAWNLKASSLLAACGNACKRSADFSQMGRGNERGLKPKATC